MTIILEADYSAPPYLPSWIEKWEWVKGMGDPFFFPLLDGHEEELIVALEKGDHPWELPLKSDQRISKHEVPDMIGTLRRAGHSTQDHATRMGMFMRFLRRIARCRSGLTIVEDDGLPVDSITLRGKVREAPPVPVFVSKKKRRLPPTADDAGRPIVRHGQYERINIPLEPEEILALIGADKHAIVLGKRVRTTGTRLGAFKRDLICVGCGLVGSRFYIERSGNFGSISHGWHLNLYAVRKSGSHALMTRDHIMPTSRGGKNRLTNCQTMCTNCNHAKGDSVPEGIEHAPYL